MVCASALRTATPRVAERFHVGMITETLPGLPIVVSLPSIDDRIGISGRGINVDSISIPAKEVLVEFHAGILREALLSVAQVGLEEDFRDTRADRPDDLLESRAEVVEDAAGKEQVELQG